MKLVYQQQVVEEREKYQQQSAKQTFLQGLCLSAMDKSSIALNLLTKMLYRVAAYQIREWS